MTEAQAMALGFQGVMTPKNQTNVTIYAPDGTPHTCAPVDAREILASGAGYTSAPPVDDASAGTAGLAAADPPPEVSAPEVEVKPAAVEAPQKAAPKKK